MFGYNNYNNNNSFFSNPQTQHQQNLNDQFWNNSGKNRSGQFKQQDESGYNRGYKDNYGCDSSVKKLTSGMNQMSMDSNKNEKLISNKTGSSTNTDPKNLSKNTKQSKTMSWASIASQPVKAQPKSFKSKLATVVLSTTKHVPPPPPLVTQVSLDEIESIPSPWSKNKNLSSSPPLSSNAFPKDDFNKNQPDFNHKMNDNPYNRNDLRKNNQREFNRDYNRDFSNQNNQTNYRQFSSGNRQENNDNRYDNNARFGNNAGSNRFDNNRNDGHNIPKYDNRFDNRYQNRNGLNNSYNSHGSRTENRDYRDNRDIHRDSHQQNYQNYNRNDNHPRDFNNQNFNFSHNNNQGYNNYNNPHHNKQNNRGQFSQNVHSQNNSNQHQFQNQPKTYNRPGHYQQLHANNNLHSQNKIQLTQQPPVKNKPQISEQQRLQNEKEAEALLERLKSENDYNPARFEINTKNAKFFIIKSYSEDDIHRSIKYSIWCSTEHGNMKLDTAFRAQENIGPVYLFYSVNGSGHFCGVAQMVSRVDYNASSGVWAQDKWKGQFKVKWIYVKDVPNSCLRHIILENNDYKPVTNSRDTQEVPLEQGKAVLKIIHELEEFTSLFDDFLHYEQKQLEALGNRRSSDSPSPSLSSLQTQSKTNESMREKSSNRDLTSSPVESHNLNNSNNSKTSNLSNYETGYKKSWAEQCN